MASVYDFAANQLKIAEPALSIAPAIHACCRKPPAGIIGALGKIARAQRERTPYQRLLGRLPRPRRGARRTNFGDLVGWDHPEHCSRALEG